MPSDRRLAVDLRLLQEYFRSSKYTLRWVCGPQMLADSVTKIGADPTYLLQVLERGRYQVLRDRGLENKVVSGGKKASRKVTLEEIQMTQKEKLRERAARKSGNHKRRLHKLGRTSVVSHSLIAGISWITQLGTGRHHE